MHSIDHPTIPGNWNSAIPSSQNLRVELGPPLHKELVPNVVPLPKALGGGHPPPTPGGEHSNSASGTDGSGSMVPVVLNVREWVDRDVSSLRHPTQPPSTIHCHIHHPIHCPIHHPIHHPTPSHQPTSAVGSCRSLQEGRHRHERGGRGVASNQGSSNQGSRMRKGRRNTTRRWRCFWGACHGDVGSGFRRTRGCVRDQMLARRDDGAKARPWQTFDGHAGQDGDR